MYVGEKKSMPSGPKVVIELPLEGSWKNRRGENSTEPINISWPNSVHKFRNTFLQQLERGHFLHKTWLPLYQGPFSVTHYYCIITYK